MPDTPQSATRPAPRRSGGSSRLRKPEVRHCHICGARFIAHYAGNSLCKRRACRSEAARRNRQRYVRARQEREAAEQAARDRQARKKERAGALPPAIRRDLERARRRREQRLEAILAEARVELARLEFGGIFVPRGDAAHVSTYRDDPG